MHNVKVVVLWLNYIAAFLAAENLCSNESCSDNVAMLSVRKEEFHTSKDKHTGQATRPLSSEEEFEGGYAAADAEAPLQLVQRNEELLKKLEDIEKNTAPAIKSKAEAGVEGAKACQAELTATLGEVKKCLQSECDKAAFSKSLVMLTGAVLTAASIAPPMGTAITLLGGIIFGLNDDKSKAGLTIRDIKIAVSNAVREVKWEGIADDTLPAQADAVADLLDAIMGVSKDVVKNGDTKQFTNTMRSWTERAAAISRTLTSAYLSLFGPGGSSLRSKLSQSVGFKEDCDQVCGHGKDWSDDCVKADMTKWTLFRKAIVAWERPGSMATMILPIVSEAYARLKLETKDNGDITNMIKGVQTTIAQFDTLTEVHAEILKKGASGEMVIPAEIQKCDSKWFQEDPNNWQNNVDQTKPTGPHPCNYVELITSGEPSATVTYDCGSWSNWANCDIPGFVPLGRTYLGEDCKDPYSTFKKYTDLHPEVKFFGHRTYSKGVWVDKDVDHSQVSAMCKCSPSLPISTCEAGCNTKGYGVPVCARREVCAPSELSKYISDAKNFDYRTKKIPKNIF